MKPLKLLIITLSLSIIYETKAQSNNWQYLNQPPPKETAQLFAPNVVSTSHNERDFAISPDGKEIYYSIVGTNGMSVIVVHRYQNGHWESPQIAPFSGNNYDIEPAFSPDGKQLFFASNRPLKVGDKSKDFDIWLVERQIDGSWSAPKNLGEPINTAGNEFYPSITKEGTLYYTATLTEGLGDDDIVYAKLVNGVYQKPVVLPVAINSKGGEYNAFIDPDEKYLIFGAYKRADDLGGGDLYISFRQNGTWQPAKSLTNVNSKRIDYCPYISPDGQYFFFTSERTEAKNSSDKPLKISEYLQILDSPKNGNGDIYWVEASTILK